MQVLITGAAGFIGSHLADRLLAAGHEVRGLDILDSQVHAQGERPAYLNPDVDLRVGDVRDHDSVANAVKDVDAVLHLAAVVGVGQSMYEIERYTSVNAVGCAVLLEEVLKRRDRVQKIVLASSMSIYGEGQYANPATGEVGFAPGLRLEKQLTDRQWELTAEDGATLVPESTAETKCLRPTSVYAISKRDQEEMMLSFGAAYGLPVVALRFFNVYGRRQALSNPYTGVVAIFASRLLNNRRPIIFEDGRQTRDFIDVRDITEGCVLALTTSGANGEAVNLGTGKPTSVFTVADTLARGLGVTIEPEMVGKYRAGDIRHCFADTRRAEDRLGFRARIGFEEGMHDLLGWLAEQEASDQVDVAYAALAKRGLAR